MCDTIAALRAATSTGSVLFGKNSDRDYLEAQYLELLPAVRHEVGAHVRLTYKTIEQAPETYAVLLSKPHWIWGAEIGANAHGLVIGNEAIFSRIEASLAEGIIGMDYVRLALERARSADEAIHVITTLLRKHGQGGNCGFRSPIAYHNSYLLADFNGVKVLETVERDWAVTSVTSHYAISNAMTIEPFRSAFEDETKSASGDYRRGRAMSLLQRSSGRLRVADFFDILRDHNEGPSMNGRPGPRICTHRRENPIGQTTASWVAELAPDRAVHWVTGTAAPCTGLFKPILLEAGLPGHGARPGTQEDRASLWWRHERLRLALDQCDADLSRAFIEERNILETRFLEAIRTAHAEIHRIVEACWREALDFEARWFGRLVRNDEN